MTKPFTNPNLVHFTPIGLHACFYCGVMDHLIVAYPVLEAKLLSRSSMKPPKAVGSVCAQTAGFDLSLTWRKRKPNTC